MQSHLPAGVEVVVVPTPEELLDRYGAEKEAVADEVLLWPDWIESNAAIEEPPFANRGAMMYTSGTTGRPRGVMREPPSEPIGKSSFEMFLTITGMAPYLDRPEEATALMAAPLYHGTPNGWAQALVPMGVNLVIETKFDAEQVLAHIEEYRITHALLVPTMFVRLLRLPEAVRKRYDLSSLKFVMHAGAPCPAPVKRDMIDWLGLIVSEHYGSTEVGVITYCDAQEWLDHPGTVGKALEHVKIEIVDENDEPQPTGETGEILCRNFGFPNFSYHNDPEKRARAERHGLISLGDVGYLDDDGYLYLCSRSSEMIISGGTNIYPAEIEAELLKNDAIVDCAVFGIPDDEFGEKVCAYIQPRPGVAIDEDAIVTRLRANLAGYKIPRRIVLTDELPREDSGKVFKRRLRNPYWKDKNRTI